MAERHEAWDHIEPQAASVTQRPDFTPGEHAIELSKAISLKRIADALIPIEAHLRVLRQHREEHWT